MSAQAPQRVLIALGANVAPRANLPEAVARLAAAPDVRLIAVSRVWRTRAVGAPGPDYLNAAVALDTPLDPDALRERVLRPIEAALGRVRGPDRNAPRPIDLDIAAVGALLDPERGIPDPEIPARPHLALPLADIAPGWREPRTGLPLARLAARLAEEPGIALDPLDLPGPRGTVDGRDPSP